MSYDVKIRAAAEANLQDAYLYYEECRNGLGSDFLLCVEDSIEKIGKTPNHYPTVYKGIQRI